jgi:hypothetical protein
MTTELRYTSAEQIYKNCLEIKNSWFAGERFWESSAIKAVDGAKKLGKPIGAEHLGVFLITEGLNEQIVKSCKKFYCFNNESQIAGIWDPVRKAYRFALTSSDSDHTGEKQNFISLMSLFNNDKKTKDFFNFAQRMGAFPDLGAKSLYAVIDSGTKNWRYGHDEH